MCLVPVAGKHTLSGPHIASSNRQTRAPALVQEVTVFFLYFFITVFQDPLRGYVLKRLADMKKNIVLMPR